MIQAEISQQSFDALAETLEAQEGIVLKGTGGKVSAHHSTVAWSYIQGLLRLTVTSAPLGMDSVVESRLRDALIANGVVPR